MDGLEAPDVLGAHWEWPNILNVVLGAKIGQVANRVCAYINAQDIRAATREKEGGHSVAAPQVNERLALNITKVLAGSLEHRIILLGHGDTAVCSPVSLTEDPVPELHTRHS